MTKTDVKITKQLPSQKPQWYVLHTYSGYEDTVARNLRQRIESLGMQDFIFNVMVPTEKKIKIHGGKKKVVEEKVYPGYVLVEMVVTDESWYVVRNTPRVTGFVGAGNIPISVEPAKITELERIIKEEPEYKIEFKIGDSVKIKTGPFRDFNGKVSEIDEKRGRVKVLVDMFGRETPVELNYLEVQKI
ncbi:MAG: transcription termination/antitermination factor NusG [Candidatus Portnoybacteria bacterium]|nr:transcription termination/antitermination factor NusG [Candidatus Portnoybacteria bacterium]